MRKLEEMRDSPEPSVLQGISPVWSGCCVFAKHLNVQSLIAGLDDSLYSDVCEKIL